MKAGFNIIIDAQHGSSGKGKLSVFLADKWKVGHVSSSNFPNAGHTAVVEEPTPLGPATTKFVAKALPTAAILAKLGRDITCYLSPASGFSWDRLRSEIGETGIDRQGKLFIHDRASIVTDAHAARERRDVRHIASTMQGSGAALIDKIGRGPNVLLARSDPRPEFAWQYVVGGSMFRYMTHEMLSAGHTWLHEGSQGYALSIDHGSNYPECTSRNCTAQAAMDQMACPSHLLGDIWLNVRTFPIRVGNIDGGNSGSGYKDQHEISWDRVAQDAGIPDNYSIGTRELTTVTKRLRRVFSFSWFGLEDAARSNGATKIAINFAQYLDFSCYRMRGESFSILPAKVRKFIDDVEDTAKVTVCLVGTGEAHEHMVARSGVL